MILLFLVLMLAPSVFSEVTEPHVERVEASSSDAQDIALRIQKINSCSDKVWPSLKLGQYPLYVADYNGTRDLKELVELDVMSGKVKAAPSETVDLIKKKGFSPYFVDVTGGKTKGVAVSVNRPGKPSGGPQKQPQATPSKPMMCADEDKKYSQMMSSAQGASPDSNTKAVDLLMHEAFHNVDQNSSHSCHQGQHSWQGDFKNFSRNLKGDDKMVSNSILYRTHMIHFLKKAIENPTRKSEFMGEAALWYKKWIKEYPEAVNELRTLDRSEGSASYVGSMSAAIGKEGCQNKEAIRQSFLTNASSKISNIPSAVDTQAYGLGAAAGLLLDEYGDTSWKKKLTQGKSPMELLAEKFNFNTQAQPKVVAEIQGSQNIYENYNKCLKNETLTDVQDAYARPQDYVAIAVKIESPLRHPAPSFLLDEKDWQLTSYKTPSFDMENWSQTRETQTDCGSGKYSIILVPKASVQAGSVEASSTRGKINGSVSDTPKGQYDSFPLYCSH